MHYGQLSETKFIINNKTKPIYQQRRNRTKQFNNFFFYIKLNLPSETKHRLIGPKNPNSNNRQNKNEQIRTLIR